MKIKSLLLILLLSCSLFTLADQTVEEENQSKKTKNWKTRLELSSIRTTGNTENESFASKLENAGKIGTIKTYLDASIIIQNSNDIETANQILANARAEKLLNAKVFVLVESKYERDKFSGYDYRASLGPGIGYDFISTDESELKTFVSAQYHYDNLSDPATENKTYWGLQFALDGRFQPQENLELNNEFEYRLSARDTENYRIYNKSAAVIKINSFLSLGLSYIINFENLPATSALERVNTTFLTSLIFSW